MNTPYLKPKTSGQEKISTDQQRENHLFQWFDGKFHSWKQAMKFCKYDSIYEMNQSKKLDNVYYSFLKQTLKSGIVVNKFGLIHSLKVVWQCSS